MVELDGLIYVLGGENEETELITVEVFDPHFNTWKMQTSMTMIRKVTTQPGAQTHIGYFCPQKETSIKVMWSLDSNHDLI